jgi:hypothetical protein
MQAKLSALQPAFQMDPVEKALRMGGVREEAKKLEEDGGTIAGECDLKPPPPRQATVL